MSAWEGSKWQESAEVKEARDRAGQIVSATAVTYQPQTATTMLAGQSNQHIPATRPRTLATVAVELEGEMRAAKAGKAAEERIPKLRAELEALLNGTEAP
jgi:hypothetical protein